MTDHIDPIDPANQTQFTFEEPIFEGPPPEPGTQPQLPVPWYRQPKILIAGVGITIVLFVIALMLQKPVQEMIEEEPQATQTPLPAALSPLEQRINLLKTELQSADPATQDLPFPPVNMELQLAEPAD